MAGKKPKKPSIMIYVPGEYTDAPLVATPFAAPVIDDPFTTTIGPMDIGTIGTGKMPTGKMPAGKMGTGKMGSRTTSFGVDPVTVDLKKIMTQRKAITNLTGNFSPPSIGSVIGKVNTVPVDTLQDQWSETLDVLIDLGDAISRRAAKWTIEEIEVGLTLSAEGQLLFIAKGGVEASIKVTLKPKTEPLPDKPV